MYRNIVKKLNYYVTQIYHTNEIGHVISGKNSSRKQLGLPDNWNLVEEWLDATGDNSAGYESTVGNFTPKWPNIPVLRDYSVDPGEEYWKQFPSRPMPMKPESSIDADKLEVMVKDRKHKMTNHEYIRAMKAVEFLRNGAPSHQKSSLPDVL